MKDIKKKSASLQRSKSSEATAKDRRQQASLLRTLSAEGEPAAAGHASVVGDKSVALPANATPLARVVEELQHTYGNTYVQRLVSEVTGATSGQSPNSGGQRIDPGTKAVMEGAFEEDFSDVRLHADRQAQEAAEHLGAQAFTRGNDIYFGTGAYDPSTEAGKRVLAHELVHVIQQRGGTGPQQGASAVATNDSHEREANRAETDVSSGQRPLVASRTTSPVVQRKEKREQPTTSRHSREIAPMPTNGAVDAAGRFSVVYVYTVANPVVLTLHVPTGVAATVLPLTDLGGGDFRINDPGGTGARAVAITVATSVRMLPRVQVTLTQGSFTYVVVFQFLKSSEQAEHKEPGAP